MEGASRGGHGRKLEHKTLRIRAVKQHVPRSMNRT
jgi:hypothetical protein